MFDEFRSLPDIDKDETHEWLEALDDIVQTDGPARARYVVREVLSRARELDVGLSELLQTPYINTILPANEPAFPGDEAMEKRIRRIIRWNAMAMVTRANMRFEGLGGHISTYASSASLYEVGFNHFFRGKDAPGGGDQIYFQGHAAPGIYARAFLEGRISEAQLEHFRRETGGKGLSSYPHPWLMPDFWEFPTVSMGLGPLTAIYQARFNRYLHNRGIKDTSGSRVWAFIGDGEVDEPESLGALHVAARERLNNLTFVVNCNLQRLDGPVRGNGKIIQELEAVFRGAGWHVIKVIWGPEWDPLLARDVDGLLVKRMNETVDGQYQRYSIADGAYIREHFFGPEPQLQAMVENFSDLELTQLRRGGHSYRKLYAAFDAATQNQEAAPVVILAKTVKGWTLGDGFEGSNRTHQMKKLDLEQLKKFRDTLHLPIDDAELVDAPFYHPGVDSEEVQYLHERRHALGGYLPSRARRKADISSADPSTFAEFYAGSKSVEPSTTMAFARLLRKLLRDPAIGERIVPIIPDEARTFGLETLFREIGIYAPFGQKYDPVDSHVLLNYHESQTGQLLEEGISEAGSVASFAAAATSLATHGKMTIPFYIFYSMFGLQRTGDQVWALADQRGRGFMLGATAGRTTLNGEGLQHQDGHSHLLANTPPNLVAYDPAYAYEVAVIIRDGLRRMIDEGEDIFYYITLYNENYVMPAMPPGVEEGILRGLYRARESSASGPKAQIFGSGSMIQSALAAQEMLAQSYNVAADVWSVTSYQQLFRDGRAAQRYNLMHPTDVQRTPYVTAALGSDSGPVVAVSDWIQEVPSLISRFVRTRFTPLGTNGFGRSDTRAELRNHFEVDARWVTLGVLSSLAQEGALDASVVSDAIRDLDIDADKVDPMVA